MEALKRRTCRTFKETPIEKEKLEKILEAGRYAPTGKDLQELCFHVITDKAMLNDLVKKTQEHFKNTPENAAMANNAITFGGPAVICMTCNKELVKWAPYDCGFACQNMLITAESLGIATLPLGIIKRATNVWLEALKVPEEELLMAVVFGYPTEDFKPKEKVLKSKVIYH